MSREAHGFRCMSMDQCVFVLNKDNAWLVAWVYVDDMGVFGEDSLKTSFMQDLATDFAVTNKGQLQYYLGMNCKVTEGQVSLDQAKYIGELLAEFRLMDVYPATTPMLNTAVGVEPSLTEAEHAQFRRMVGCLVYIMVMTRPDIAYAVSCVSRHMHAPQQGHMRACKRIYAYLAATRHHALTYSSHNTEMLTYVDSNFGNCTHTGRSQSGMLTVMCGAALVWRSVRQPVVAQSTSEAEFIAMCEGAKELIYINQFIEETGIQQLQQPGPSYAGVTAHTDQHVVDAAVTHSDMLALVRMQGDNEGAIKMAQEGADTTRTRHVHRRYYFLRDLVRMKWLQVEQIRSSKNLADPLTKPLGKAMVRFTAVKMGLRAQQQ